MFYANKKTTATVNQAQQTAKILANVKELLDKRFIFINDDVVVLNPQLWKDRLTALNWMRCLHLYCVVKRHITEKSALYFEDAEGKRIGAVINKTPKLIDFTFAEAKPQID